MKTITGMKIRNSEGNEEDIFGDFVIDCGGSNSKQTGTHLLNKIGIHVDEEIVDAGIGYCSAFYKFKEDVVVDGVTDPKFILIQPSPENGQNKGIAIGKMEGELYHLNWYAFNREYPPTTDEELFNYTKQLRYPEISEMLQKGERVTPLIPYRDVCSRRVRCDTCKEWPENYIILGDSMANYTPTYGQGMTFAALSALELDKLLDSSSTFQGLSKQYIKKVTPLLDLCWNASVGEDLCVPGVKFNCAAPPGHQFFHKYMSLFIQHVCETLDPPARTTFVKVMNMTLPPYYLLSPHIAIKVIGQLIKNQFRK